MRKLLRHGDLWLIFALFGTILLLILPIPPFLLDLLLTISIGLSLLTLLVILYLRTPAEFTGFPTLLLFITLYRLALNVASTRLILLDGYAGHIIESFGNFVVRGNYVVGLVVFLHPGAHQFHRHHQGRRPHRGSGGAVHAWTPCPANKWPLTPN